MEYFSFGLKKDVYAEIFLLSFFDMIAIMLESIPPDKNTPTLVSLIRFFLIVSNKLFSKVFTSTLIEFFLWGILKYSISFIFFVS